MFNNYFELKNIFLDYFIKKLYFIKIAFKNSKKNINTFPNYKFYFFVKYKFKLYALKIT